MGFNSGFKWLIALGYSTSMYTRSEFKRKHAAVSFDSAVVSGWYYSKFQPKLCCYLQSIYVTVWL